MPKVLSYPDGAPKHSETASVWRNLTTMARERIEILSFYWTLKDVKHDEAVVGAEILLGLKEAAKRGILMSLWFSNVIYATNLFF